MDEEKLKFSVLPHYIGLVTLILHIVLYVAKRIWKKEEAMHDAPATSSNHTVMTIDGIRITLTYLIIVPIIFAIAYVMKYFPEPAKLNQSPNNLFIYAVYIILPFLIISVVSLIYFINSAIRRAVHDEFFSR